MNAELKIIFEEIPTNLVLLLSQSFANNSTLEKVISNSIYSDREHLHDCFVHGFLATDATLLFQIVGNELLIHIEIPSSNNSFVTLKKKVNSYYLNIIRKLKNNNINTEKIKQEAVIIVEDSYLFAGKINSNCDEFKKQIDKDKFRLIILPVVLLIINFIAFKTDLINDIKTVLINFASQIMAIIIWYLLEYLKLSQKSEFTFQNINE